MNDKRKKILIFALIGLTALTARLSLLYLAGPQTMTDTSQYIDVSRTLAETGTFSVKDPATGKLAPFAMRVPLFHACLAVLIKLPGRDIVPKFVFANILLSSAIAVLTGALFCSLAGLLPGALAGFFMALDPNSVYNALVLLPDTFFSFAVLLAAMLGLKALRAGTFRWFLGWGAAIGLTALVKPVFKYFWAAPVFLVLAESALRKQAVKNISAVLLGFALIVSPWLARNYAQLGFAGFELIFGINTIWSTIDLVKPSTAEQARRDPVLAAVRDMAAASGTPSSVMENIKTRLKISDVESNEYLSRIGLEVALGNPAEFGARYAKNAFNFITSPSSVLELYYLASPGGENDRRPLKEALALKLWAPVLVNTAARAAWLAVFFLGAAGLIVLAGRDRPGALLLFALVAYLTLISSFTAGYDRYRLPIDPFLAGLAAIALGTERVKRLFAARPRSARP